MHNREDRLSIALGLASMKPADLARALHVLPQHVNNWRKRGVPAAMLLKAAKAMNVRPEWLGHVDAGPIQLEKSASSSNGTSFPPDREDSGQADDPTVKMLRQALKLLIDQMDPDELEAIQLEHEKIQRLRRSWERRTQQ